jgi:hypothetical protein
VKEKVENSAKGEKATAMALGVLWVIVSQETNVETALHPPIAIHVFDAGGPSQVLGSAQRLHERNESPVRVRMNRRHLGRKSRGDIDLQDFEQPPQESSVPIHQKTAFVPVKVFKVRERFRKPG